MKHSKNMMLVILVSLFGTAIANAQINQSRMMVLSGHIPDKAIARSTYLGRKASTDRMQLAISLQTQNQTDLAETLRRLYDPNDSLYHQFLTPSDFAARYSPSEVQVDQTVAYLRALGLTVTNTHPNRLVIDFEGTTGEVESAFQIEEHEYLTTDGRIAHAPISDPVMSEAIASHITSIVGLSSFSFHKPHLKSSKSLSTQATPHSGSVSDYMTPAKIKSGYNLTSVTQTGSGETLALYELDGYTASDITAYTSYFSLTTPTLTNVLVDSATGTAGSNKDEVTLDIELSIALAPGLTKIMVYEGPNTSSGALDTYNRIATDNLANEISTSWGEAENEMTSSELNSENTIFTQFATQGQSFFAAAGDNGAYDDSVNGTSTLEVDDPGSQPYATSVGGTLVTLTSGNVWQSETSWATTPTSGTYGQSGYTASVGGGGGISTFWSIPSWQSGLATTPNKGSTTKRMVPDVSLEADPSNGYPIYVGGSWQLYGGTSCAAPLWAAFTALVNQKRISTSQTRMGFINPAIYNVGKGSSYSSSFHDIADASTNLYYPAETGYDLTTGWGSFNGAGLFTALTAVSTAPYAPNSVTLTAGQLSIGVSWTASSGASTYTLSRSTSSGGTYTAIGSALTSTSYTDSGLTYGTTYCYEVTATNTYGTSGATSPVSATPNPTPPPAPTDLTAQAVSP
jgi:subtilase family serine protease